MWTRFFLLCQCFFIFFELNEYQDANCISQKIIKTYLWQIIDLVVYVGVFVLATTFLWLLLVNANKNEFRLIFIWYNDKQLHIFYVNNKWKKTTMFKPIFWNSILTLEHGLNLEVWFLAISHFHFYIIMQDFSSFSS